MTLYGVALALAFGAGIALAWRRARVAGLDAERVLDASLVILPASIVGARALWLITHPGSTRGAAGEAGLSMLGGVVLSAAACTAYLRLRGLPILRYADALAPSVAFGEGITRIGCFLQGCCAGAATALPWGVRAGVGDALLHPAQLYAALAAFAGFAGLTRLVPRRAFDGAAFFALLGWLGASRIALDRFRAYDGEAAATSSHVFAALLAAAGVVGLIAAHSRSRRA